MKDMNHICVACGTQYPPAKDPPESCCICLDERQFVPPEGQQWTTQGAMRLKYRNKFTQEEEGVYSIKTVPKFAIGQRALLIQTEAGNILWDCLSFLDNETISTINKMGGLIAIAISHPHFYGAMRSWSQAFGGIPIYLCERDLKWVVNPGPEILFWGLEQSDSTLEIMNSEIVLIRCGGHFDGSCVLLWTVGKGTLFTADTIHVVPDKRFVTFMWSFPNMIPLSATAIEGIWRSIQTFEFDSIYGAFSGLDIASNAKNIVWNSGVRYLRAIGQPNVQLIFGTSSE